MLAIEILWKEIDGFATREFIKSMEQRRLGPKGWVSIFSLMRAGRELRRKLQAACAGQQSEQQLKLIRGAIAPYLQVVESGATCEFTGMKITDIGATFDVRGSTPISDCRGVQ